MSEPANQKNMDLMKEIFRGIVIGVANIIPGVSGGTMAVSMGIYDSLIHAVTHITKEPKKSIKTLFPYGVGMLLGIGVLAFVINAMFEKFPLQTSMCFVGLILGGIPIIFNQIKRESKGIPHLILFVLFAAVVVGMALLSDTAGQDVELKLSIWMMVQLFFVGVVAAATMVIPGVSGSMMLMLMGFYQPILGLVEDFIRAAMHFDIGEAWSLCGYLVPFGLGVLIGIGVIAKIIEWVLDKHRTLTFCGIMGLIIASPFAVLWQADVPELTPAVMITSGLTLAVGFAIAFMLAKDEVEEW